jgi:uncharacterized protein
MSNPPLQETPQKALSILLITLGVTIISMILMSVLALGIIIIFFDSMNLSTLQEALENPYNHPQIRPALLVFQAISTPGSFILTAILVRYLLVKVPYTHPLALRTQPVTLYLLGALAWLAAMPQISFIAEWNQNIDFGPLDEQFRQSEKAVEKLTEFMLDFSSTTNFLLGLVVIALLPAISEELLFRGILQRQLRVLTRNPHVAIWLSGFIFSLIHMQMFGLVPRWLLGVLFGYLYYYSANLYIPMLCHFFNNGIIVVMYYLNKTGAVDMDPESLESSGPWYLAIVSLIATTALVLYFRKRTNLYPPATSATGNYYGDNTEHPVGAVL